MDYTEGRARAIIVMLSGRGGFDGFWDGIDSDIQEDIIDEIASIISGQG